MSLDKLAELYKALKDAERNEAKARERLSSAQTSLNLAVADTREADAAVQAELKALGLSREEF